MRKMQRACSFAPEAGIAVFTALSLDLLGEPPAALHPVVWYGRLIHYLEQAAPEKPLARFFYGLLMLALAAPAALLPATLIHWMARHAYAAALRYGNRTGGFMVYVLLEGAALKPFFALRMLVDAGRSVRMHLEQENLAAARQALQALVSRDRSQLTEHLVGAAAIESLAENLSDAVVAPLFY